MKKRLFSLLVALTLLAFCIPFGEAAEATGTIKNIIYLIPDGGGYGPYDFANMVKTSGGFNKFDNKTPTTTDPMTLRDYLTGSIITEPYGGGVTDSAAAGTALATGNKTYNNYLGVDHTGKPVANLVEAAKSVNKATGLIATYEWMHATPAAFSAHAMDRNEYKNLYRQIENKGIDVVLGAGYGAVADYAGIQNAIDRGYKIVKTKEDFAAVAPGDKIWGNVSSTSLPYDIELSPTQPTLAEMTDAAITALSEDEDGFFLMVEGSKVDTGGHANDALVTTSEYLAFDAAFKVAVDFAKKRNDTVVIAVPDHDTGGMILKPDMTAEIEAVRNGTDPSTLEWESPNHTGQNVGVWMYLPEGVETISGFNNTVGDTQSTREDYVLQNTAIAPYLAGLMGVNLDELSDELFVDVTNMGIYKGDTEKFSFYSGDKYAYRNESVYYEDGEEKSMNGKEMLYINNRIYLPADIIDEDDRTATGGTAADPNNVLRGNGSKEDPYLIEDTDDFLTFTSELMNGNSYSKQYLKQTSNVDLAGNDLYFGVTSEQYFSGVYDGNGHTINVDMTTSADNCIFPYVTGTIMNLGTTGTINSYGSYAAGIARSLRDGAKMINCYSTVNINGTTVVRGLAVSNYGTISNCYFAGVINSNEQKTPISNNGTYENCYYVDTCGATQENEGITAISEEVAQSTLGETLNNGREAAATRAGVTVEEISEWGQNFESYPTFIKSIPIIETVTVSPEKATVYKGGSIQLTAKVTGKNSPSQKVKWAIEASNKMPGTTITEDGLLTVDTAETLESFTVIAKSAQDGGKAGRATINVSNVAFELDYSRYQNDGLLEDAAGKARVWIEGDTSFPPILTNVRSLSEKGSYSYMTFADKSLAFNGEKGGQNARAYIDERILGQKELSIEFWARSSRVKGRWDRIFSLGGDEYGKRLDVEVNEYQTQFRVGLGMSGDAEEKIISENNFWNGEWQHFVISRKWDNGTLTATVYANGELLGEKTVTDAPDPAIWETDKWTTEQEYKVNLAVGGQTGGRASFRGDIASFKIYNKNMTPNEIAESYEAGKNELTPLVVSNLDLSEYDGRAATIKDAGAQGTSSAIYQSDYVKKGTYTNLKGEEVPYIDAYYQEVTTGNETVKHRGRAYIHNNAYGELENYTVGVWAKIPSYTKNIRSWGTIIAHTDANGSDKKIFDTELDQYSNTFMLRTRNSAETDEVKDSSYASIEPYQDAWAYYTFTKEWTKNENNEDVVTLKAYINGNELRDAYASGVIKDKESFMGYDAFGLGAFHHYSGDGGSLTDFASFTVYNKALSPNEIEAEYLAMRDDYSEYCEIDVNFDNFDGYNASTLSNRNKNTEATFTLLGSEITPEAKSVKEIPTANGARKILSVNQSKSNRLLVSSSGLSNQNELSVEMWVKYESGWGRFFSASSKTAKKDGGEYLDTWLDGNDNGSIQFRPFGNDTADEGFVPASTNGFMNQWSHFVFNRKLVTNDDGNDHYVAEIYLNGALADKETYTRAISIEEELTFTVLGTGECGTAITDLGSFIIRNKTLSKNEVAAAYEAQKDNYKPASITVTAEIAENSGYDVTVKNDFANNIDCTLFLAAYDFETNKFAGCDMAIFTDGIDAGESASDNLFVEALDSEKAYNFKIFVWDDSMKPYINPLSYDYKKPEEKPEEKVPELVVDMDLSSYDGTAASIIDSTGNGAIFSQSEHVKKGSFINASGNEIPYIDLFSENGMCGRAWVKASNTEGFEKETISCWVKMDSEDMEWGVLLAKVNAMDTDEANFEVGIGGDNEIWVMPSGNGSDIGRLPIAPYKNGWNMFTFTREWIGNTLIWKTYVNGVSIDNIAFSGTSNAFTKKLEGYETYGLSTKFSGEGDGGALVDFATFKVYNGILSDSQIFELYESTYQNFN